MQTIANACFGLKLTYRVESLNMRLQHRAHYHQGALEILLARWEIPQQVAQDCIDVWLVKGDPEIAEVLQLRGHIGDIAYKQSTIGSISKTAAIDKPERLGK